MTEPNQEQIKEFWTKCGWRIDNDGSFEWWYRPEGGHLPLGEKPALDLNNLFKWAVPKLQNFRQDLNTIKFIATSAEIKEPDRDWSCSIDHNFHTIANKFGSTPALALFWAINETLNGK